MVSLSWRKSDGSSCKLELIRRKGAGFFDMNRILHFGKS